VERAVLAWKLTLTLAISCGLAATATAQDPSILPDDMGYGAVDSLLSRSLGEVIRRSDRDFKQCWSSIERVDAIPDSLDLAKHYQSGISDELPEVKSYPRLDPSSVGMRKYSGRILVSALVDTTGRVATVCLVEESGTALDRLVVEAAFGTTFVPGTKQGVAVPVWVYLPFQFRP
jgi:TonB family protein